MHPAPFPVEFKPLRSAPHDLNQHRNVFCRRYSACLDTALKRDWEDFSCHQCELCHKDESPSVQEFALHQPPAP